MPLRLRLQRRHHQPQAMPTTSTTQTRMVILLPMGTAAQIAANITAGSAR
jgi:hypothetical protein